MIHKTNNNNVSIKCCSKTCPILVSISYRYTIIKRVLRSLLMCVLLGGSIQAIHKFIHTYVLAKKTSIHIQYISMSADCSNHFPLNELNAAFALYIQHNFCFCIFDLKANTLKAITYIHTYIHFLPHTLLCIYLQIDKHALSLSEKIIYRQ